MSEKLGPGFNKDGSFARPESVFRRFVSRDPESQFPAEANRYVLYLNPGCPWAHRSLVMRKLKGLESLIDVHMLHHQMGPEGWYFSGEGDSPAEDPLHPGVTKLRQLYFKMDPEYSGRFTVPVLWDTKTDVMVNNESAEITRMFATEFEDLVPEPYRNVNMPGGGLYPENLRAEIEAINDKVYNNVNNGVYKVGFAKAQEPYDENVDALFGTLDELDDILSKQPYLVGEHLTEADVRLYTTMVRFDLAYNTAFQCSRKSVRNEYPNLHRWLRRLLWDEDGKYNGAFGDTTLPYAHRYLEAYCRVRHKVVYEGQGPLIVPSVPDLQTLIPPLSASRAT